MVAIGVIFACDFNSNVCLNVISTPVQESTFTTPKFRILHSLSVCKPNT